MDFFFHHLSLLTQFSSLITHHLKYPNSYAKSVWHHHSVMFSTKKLKKLRPTHWPNVISFSLSFFFFLFPLTLIFLCLLSFLTPLFCQNPHEPNIYKKISIIEIGIGEQRQQQQENGSGGGEGIKYNGGFKRDSQDLGCGG